MQLLVALLLTVFLTHSVGPVGEVPVGDTGAHVALLTSLWADPGVALVVVHHTALITNTAHTSGPFTDTAVH